MDFVHRIQYAMHFDFRKCLMTPEIFCTTIYIIEMNLNCFLYVETFYRRASYKREEGVTGDWYYMSLG